MDYTNKTYEEIGITNVEDKTQYIAIDEKNMLHGNYYAIASEPRMKHKEDEDDTRNYRFTHWTTNPDGTGDIYNANETIKANSSMVLYAQWEQVIG